MSNKVDDEYYTRYEDIESELTMYPEEIFKDKVVCAPCDADWSEFTHWFNNNKERLGIKEFYNYSGDYAAALRLHDGIQAPKIDIVVTNPPFSIFRGFVDDLIGYGCDYIIVGVCSSIATLINCGYKINLGYSRDVRHFKRPNGLYVTIDCYWMTSYDFTVSVHGYLPITKNVADLECVRQCIDKDGNILPNFIRIKSYKDIPLDAQECGYDYIILPASAFRFQIDPDVLQFVDEDELLEKFNFERRYFIEDGKKVKAFIASYVRVIGKPKEKYDVPKLKYVASPVPPQLKEDNACSGVSVLRKSVEIERVYDISDNLLSKLIGIVKSVLLDAVNKVEALDVLVKLLKIEESRGKNE